MGLIAPSQCVFWRDFVIVLHCVTISKLAQNKLLKKDKALGNSTSLLSIQYYWICLPGCQAHPSPVS